jgi:chromosome segregation ATPase
MKSFFTRLSTLILAGTVALVGCTDFSADLQEINGRVEDLEATSATKAQVAELAAALEALKNQVTTQYATKEEVAAVVSAMDQFKTAYEQAKKDLEAAIDKKADKTELEAAVANLSKVLEDAKAEFTAAIEALQSEDAALNEALATVKASVEGLLAAVEALQGDVEALQEGLEALEGTVETLEGTVEALEGQLEATMEDVAELSEQLSELQAAFEAYQDAVDVQFEALTEQINSMSEAIVEQLAEMVAELEAADAANAAATSAAVAQIAELQAALAEANADIAELAALVAGKADQEDLEDLENATQEQIEAAKAQVEAAIAALNKSLSADIKALEALVKAWEDHDTIYDDTALKAALANATAEYKSLAAGLQEQIDALETAVEAIQGELDGIKDAIDAANTELRAAILVPDMLFNGTKAVKFYRQDGKNVLKTFATVSYRFNPSDFDASTATYEIVAEQVEVMTKGIVAEEPAIEIIGKPVQADDKVTFELERGDGAGNMFALKVTLEDGTTIYSDYAAIVDEATFALATATASFEVQRLAYEFPQLTSISAIIEYVQSLGQTVEDFSSTIQAINEAIKAMQNNDVASAIENLVSIPGLKKETKTITGVGTYRVQVETLDAAEIIEALQNAQTIDEIRKIIADLFSQAQGLGEAGSAIIDGLNNAFGGSGIDELLGQYDNLKDFQLPDLVLTYEKAVATLDQYQAELDKARAEFQSLKDEMDAIVAGLGAEVQAEIAAIEAEIAALQAQYAELQARYDAAGALEKIKIGAEMAKVLAQIEAKELAITSKAGSDYFRVKAELDLKEAGVKTAEALLVGARKAVDVADQAVKKGEETLAKLETEILAKIKNYIFENTELGKYLTDLENALGEQAWEARKQVAAGTAQLFAIDALIADLIQNYNEANQQVVDEFANSLFGRVAYLIQTKEAEQAFEAIGLTELYTVLKQLPDLLTLIIKYYPAGVDLTDFTNFNDFGSVFSDYLTGLIPETKVEWELDYFLAE